MKRTLITGLCTLSLAGWATSARAADLSFAGYSWCTKHRSTAAVPGNKPFSARHAWVDSLNRLHLKVDRDASGQYWSSAEVFLCNANGTERSLGPGTYTFDVFGSVVAGTTTLKAMDPAAVLGLFSYRYLADDNQPEIDVELSRWHDPDAPNLHYSVHINPDDPGDPGELYAGSITPDLAASTHSFGWLSTQVTFQSTQGATTHSYTHGGARPAADAQMTPRINLWIDRAASAPQDSQPVEAILSGFHFNP